MKKSNLTLLLLLLTYSTLKLSAQRPDVQRTRFRVCKHAAGGSCASTPISCGYEYTNNDSEGNSVDPCSLYDYSYDNPDAPPPKLIAVCCSNPGKTNPDNENDGRFNYFGVNMFLGVTNFILYAQCETASGSYVDSIWDFSDIIDTAWDRVVVNTYIDSANNSLVIEAWEGINEFPWFNSLSRTFVNIPQATITGQCSGSSPALGLGKISKTAKVTTTFSPNPLTIGEPLSYSIFNPESLNDNLKFTFYNSLGQIVYEFTPTSQTGVIDTSIFPSGALIVSVTSKFTKESYTIIIK